MKHDAFSSNQWVGGFFISLGLALASSHPISSFAADPVAEATQKAKQIYRNLNITAVPDSAMIIQSMVKLLQEGKTQEAAALAANTRGFYNVNVKQFASLMGSHSEAPNVPLNDFQATIMGVIRDEIDARTLLTGDFTYGPATGAGNFDQIENSGKIIASSLQQVKTNLPDMAGLLTSQTWAAEHYVAGTNRRAFEFTFREFMCTPIKHIRDVTAVDFRVRRDIDRNVGGNPMTYQTECRGCHGIMDGMAGAFSHLDFVGNRLTYRENVVAKYNQHSNVYPEGYVTEDDSWINLATENQNQVFGWRGPLSGHGVHQFGEMISNSQMFKNCMVKRVFNQLCRRAISPLENKIEQKLADQFERDNYNLKKLFLNVATHDSCGGAAPQGTTNFTDNLTVSEFLTKKEESNENSICTRDRI